MTTDPRVIECAKAIDDIQAECRWDIYREGSVRPHGRLTLTYPRLGIVIEREGQMHGSPYYKLRYAMLGELIATVCILKWLEQEPSRLMCDMGADHGGERFADGNADAVYTAMSAQAAKEIAG